MWPQVASVCWGVVAPIAESDRFWSELYNVWLGTAESDRGEVGLGLFRVGCMMEGDGDGNGTPFLVEFGAMASGAGALCCGVTGVHRALDVKPFGVASSGLGFCSDVSLAKR